MEIRRQFVNVLFHRRVILVLLLGSPFTCTAATNVGQDDPIARLGETLFADVALSSDGKTSCASCHDPMHAYAGTQARAVGSGGVVGTRNAPSLIGVGEDATFFWDGRRTKLEEAVLDPYTNPSELGFASFDEVVRQLRSQSVLMSEFHLAFGNSAEVPTREQISVALVSFVRSLKTGSSAFDRSQQKLEALPREAERGRHLFEGIAGCSECHAVSDTSSRFSDNLYHHSGIGNATTSPRLPELIRDVTNAAFDANSLGPRVLSNEEWSSLGRFVVTLQPADIGAFRTPSLRNVDRTAPYMHDGSIKTLSEAIDHEIYYRGFSTGQTTNITSAERHALLVFLQSLTDR